MTRPYATLPDPCSLSDDRLAALIVEATDLLKRRGKTGLAKEVIAGEAEDLQIETLFTGKDGTGRVLKLLSRE